MHSTEKIPSLQPRGPDETADSELFTFSLSMHLWSESDLFPLVLLHICGPLDVENLAIM